MSSPNFSFDMLYAYKKKNVWNVKKGNWLLRKLVFETFLSNVFANLSPIRKNNFRKALFQSAKKKFRKITWKLNYLILMLIEGMLLNDIRNPIKNGDFKCKTTLKLHQKQFNILTSEYSKFLIYNNPSFATKLRRSLFGHRIRQKKIRRSSYFNDHHFAKTSSGNS